MGGSDLDRGTAETARFQDRFAAWKAMPEAREPCRSHRRNESLPWASDFCCRCLDQEMSTISAKRMCSIYRRGARRRCGCLPVSNPKIPSTISVAYNPQSFSRCDTCEPARVAQSAEQLSCKQQVRSSILLSGSNMTPVLATRSAPSPGVLLFRPPKVNRLTWRSSRWR